MPPRSVAERIDMKDFKTRLAEAMAEKNIKAAELSRRTGISKPRMSQYLGGVYVPKADAICAIAQALGISEGYLLGTSEDPNPILETQNYKLLPLFDEISCCSPSSFDAKDSDYIITDPDTDADFCLIANGDGMKDARICNGDIVFVKKADAVANGEIAAVVINDKATLKRVYYYPESAKMMLLPENSNYEPLVFVGKELEQIRIIGRAIAFKSEVK